jgi:hypothetical protein
MVKDADPILTKVMNDLARVTDITRILDEQEKLNAPQPHYNRPMPGATNPTGENATNSTAPAGDAASNSTAPAATGDGAAAGTLPPELTPPADGATPPAAGAIQSKKATNATSNSSAKANYSSNASKSANSSKTATAKATATPVPANASKTATN